MSEQGRRAFWACLPCLLPVKSAARQDLLRGFQPAADGSSSGKARKPAPGFLPSRRMTAAVKPVIRGLRRAKHAALRGAARALSSSVTADTVNGNPQNTPDGFFPSKNASLSAEGFPAWNRFAAPVTAFYTLSHKRPPPGREGGNRPPPPRGRSAC